MGAGWFDPEVRVAASELSDAFLQCRDMGHRWMLGGAISRDTNGLFHRPLRCTGCKTKRVDRISASGTVYGRTYEYPDGYGMPGFGQRVQNRSAFRRVMLERALGEEIDDDYV